MAAARHAYVVSMRLAYGIDGSGVVLIAAFIAWRYLPPGPHPRRPTTNKSTLPYPTPFSVPKPDLVGRWISGLAIVVGNAAEI